jgi:DNA modification methylase
MRVEHIHDATLYLGDCREMLPTLGRVDAVVTDPPYGVGLKRKTNDFRDSAHFDAGASLQATVVYEDSPEQIQALIHSAIPMALERSTRGAITPGCRMMFEYPRPRSVGAVYVPNGAGRDPWGFGCFNPILYYGACPYLASGRGSRPNSFSDNQPGREEIDHPCPKPIGWMLWLVNRASLPGETILDPFMGSGTTGVACANLGRRFIGIEIEPKYFDIACRRIEQAYRQPRLFVEPAPRPEQMALMP